MYRNLDDQRVRETIAQLGRRISERFPDASLQRIASELQQIADETVDRVAAIRRPIFVIRLAVGLLLATLAGVVVLVPWKIGQWGKVESAVDFIQVFEPSLGALFFLSALVVFLLSVESRLKRRRALAAIHELRAMAHIVDMHQLTKDPEMLLGRGPSTPSSPRRTMTDFELSRYFDYCSEMLSLISKVATLYVQQFPDEVALSAVDEVEALTSGLSRKIWQKIMILDRIQGDAGKTITEQDGGAVAKTTPPSAGGDDRPTVNA